MRIVVLASFGPAGAGSIELSDFLRHEHLVLPSRTRTYICGPSAMVEEVQKWRTELGFNPATVLVEKYDQLSRTVVFIWRRAEGGCQPYDSMSWPSGALCIKNVGRASTLLASRC